VVDLEVIRIVTRCTTREQFISLFGRYCSSTSCFIPSTDMRPIGMATTFSIQLADGTPLLEGQGVVLDAWNHGNHRYKRAGVLLGIHRLDDSCGALFEQLLRPRTSAIPVTPRTQLQLLVTPPPSAIAELDTPTVKMPPLPLPEEPRAPGSEFILPANPLAELGDDLLDAFVECNLVVEPVITYEPVPSELGADPTVPTPRPASRGSRDMIATLIGMAPLEPVEHRAPKMIGVATQIVEPLPRPERPGLWSEPRRPRQRLAIADVTRRGLLSRIAARVRRWWLPATVATTIVSSVVATSALI
jgi:hypothetical protein